MHERASTAALLACAAATTMVVGPTRTHKVPGGRTSRTRVMAGLFVLLLLHQSVYIVAQTPDELGFPDTHVSSSRELAKFSCMGGVRNCPDAGEYRAAGGNLTVTILEMRNLPDLDGFGLAANLTDAYIDVWIGDNKRRSATIPNNLNPKWPACKQKGCTGPDDLMRDLNFGFRASGTALIVNVFDEDHGLEFGDDLIASIQLNAIYCSAFTAKVQTIPSDDDSSWQMPTQPLCVEETWVSLSAKSSKCVLPDGTINPEIPCMRLRMTSLPFQMRVEQVFIANTTVTGGMAGLFEESFPLVYGRVYSTSTKVRMNHYYKMDRSTGGMLVRPDARSNNEHGNSSLNGTWGFPPYVRFTINFDAEVFVFRRVADRVSMPWWLNESFGWTLTREYAQLIDLADEFHAVAKNFSRNTINKYGDAFGKGITLGNNIDESFRDSTLNMYFVIMTPHESFDDVPAEFSKEFSRLQFMQLFAQFGLEYLFLMWLSVRYLKRMNWRIERVHSFLAEKVVTEPESSPSPSPSPTSKGKKPTHATSNALGNKPTRRNTATTSALLHGKPPPDVIATLFYCYKQTDNNLEFRRNLYYATMAVYLCLSMPFILLIPWGIASVSLITPPAFGFAVLFLGVSAMLTGYGLIRWQKMGWRMTNELLVVFVSAFGFAFFFLFMSTLADPKVFFGNEKIDFMALTSIWLTLNMMPMIWICFTNDVKLAKSVSQIIAAVSASKKMDVVKNKFKNLGATGPKSNGVRGAADATAAAGAGAGAGQDQFRSRRKRGVFASVMGDNYSIHNSIQGFERADVLQSAFVSSTETRHKKNLQYYGIAMGALLIYVIIASKRTDFPAQSVGISVTVVFFDGCVFLLSRGFLSWSPGFIVFLMGGIRVSLALTCGNKWILGYALCFMIVGTALCVETIGKYLPRMSKHEAGAVTFFGHDHQHWQHLDMSTTPVFVLGLISFVYVFLLLSVAFGDKNASANQTVKIWRQDWPLWVFGVVAFAEVLFTGLAAATSRAFFLQREQLLSDYAMHVYLFVQPFSLPFMLAASLEILVVCSGLFIYAATKSTFVLVTSIFGPMILMLTLAVFVQWRKNDYRLVIWPPEEEEEMFLEDEDFNEEEAYEKEAEAMREAFVLPPLRAAGTGTGTGPGGAKPGATKTADGEVGTEDIPLKMPSLPAKGTLQERLLKGMTRPKKNQDQKVGPEAHDANHGGDKAANGNPMSKRASVLAAASRAAKAKKSIKTTAEQDSLGIRKADGEEIELAAAKEPLGDSGETGTTLKTGLSGIVPNNEVPNDDANALANLDFDLEKGLNLSAPAPAGDGAGAPGAGTGIGEAQAGGGGVGVGVGVGVGSSAIGSPSRAKGGAPFSIKRFIGDLFARHRGPKRRRFQCNWRCIKDVVVHFARDTWYFVTHWREKTREKYQLVQNFNLADTLQRYRANLKDMDLSTIDFNTMTLYDAFRYGFLLPQDYVTLFAFGLLLLLVFIYGIVLSVTETPAWMGHLVWILAFALSFGFLPLYKFFQIGGQITSDMVYVWKATYFFAWIAGLSLFCGAMHSNVNKVEALWILNALVLLPLVVVAGLILFQWKKQHYHLSPTIPDDRKLLKAGSVCLAAYLFWIWELYIFASVALGVILTVFTVIVGCVGFFFYKWMENDYFLAPKYQKVAHFLLISATCAVLFIGFVIGMGFFVCLSIVFVILLLKVGFHLAMFYYNSTQQEMEFFLTPYLFPIFSYNAFDNNVTPQNEIGKHLYQCLLICFCWGVAGVLFLDPLSVGIGSCSLVLLVLACITAHLCSVTPVKLGLASKFLNEAILRDSSLAACEVFDLRRKPFVIECTEFIEQEKKDKKAELEFQAIAYGFKKPTKQQQQEQLEKQLDAIGLGANSRALPPHKSAADIALEIVQNQFECRRRTDEITGDECKLGDGLYDWKDFLHDALDENNGPFGFLYLVTVPFRVFKLVQQRYFPSKGLSFNQQVQNLMADHLQAEQEQDALNLALSAQASGTGVQDKQVTKALQQKLEDIKKNNTTDKDKTSRGKDPPISPESCTDLVDLLLELPILDEELDREYFEETRCVIHFQLLLLNAAEARLSREKILFQKFLRENRFKLMSNGINPPANIFKTSSFASIDIPLVAVWLSSLTPEERARFHALKASFNEEMERLDAIIDAEDAQTRFEQQELREFWKPREEEMFRKRLQEYQARHLRREEQKRQAGEDLSANDKAAVDEVLLNTQEAILEIESGYSCNPGEYGRALQFVDREFPPDRSSIANCANEQEIVDWRVSMAINVVAGLFDGGTDPDDICSGKLNDGWLLSAISIIAASGGIDDGQVDPLIDKIFLTKQTSLTGAYAIRLFKNCQWETVIVDDHFPVLDDSHKSEPCAGAAFAHSKRFEELWVPLLEKACAKYYGGYAALEKGFVHHALKELTSYDSEEIFLSQAARGTLKKTLWKQLLIFKTNKFLMGAGSITSENADHEILDMGISFDSCYVIYDIQEIQGHQLIKLRNPPGDHLEWRGDWSDHSPLWRRKMRQLLHYNPQADDNTFWMHFDDFCHVFRSVYVCRYYDPLKWPIVIKHGAWQGDTAWGLPTRHNNDCLLENNPQYSLSIRRPTEVIITLTQVDPSGQATLQILPISMYVVIGMGGAPAAMTTSAVVAPGTPGTPSAPGTPGAKQTKAAGNRRLTLPSAFGFRTQGLDRALRVRKLEKEYVVAHTGEPVRQREIQIHCTLEARMYTLLVTAYKKGMEGPFQLKIQSNYPVDLDQLWPAQWKDPSKVTFAEKMAQKLQTNLAESSAMTRILEKKNKLMDKVGAGLAIVENVMKDNETILQEELQRQQKEIAHAKSTLEQADSAARGEHKKKPDKPVWVEEWDETSGKPFYFNKQTGISTFDKPADFYE